MDTTERILLALGALLHDIGKFAQRAGQPYSCNLEQEYCPGGNSHLHVLYTDYFVEHRLPLPPELEQHRSKLARLASAHHRPDASSLLETCLSNADCLSSGGDRVQGESGGTYKTARLESIFNIIAFERRNKVNRRYVLKPIDEDDAIFPVEPDIAEGSTYPELWQKFEKELSALPLNRGPSHYLHSLQSCMERFTWCIPSSTYKTRADISLYDHSHTTAAIAQALYAYRKNGVKGDEILLVGGELSGIQKYIFASGGDSDKGAGRLLRARSFVIQMLTRSIWMIMLEHFGLESTAKIMDAGGKFILLLPNTDEIGSMLQKLTAKAEQHLLNRYGGLIKITFAKLAIPAADMQMTRFQHRLDEFNTLLNENKLHPFQQFMAHGMPATLPFRTSDYAAHGECAVCGLCPACGTDDEGRSLCHDCELLISQVGRRLPMASFVVLSHAQDGYPLFDGLKMMLTDDEPSVKDTVAVDIINLRNHACFTAMPVAGYIPHIEEGEPERWAEDGRFQVCDGLPVFDGDVLHAGMPKTFGVLAGLSRIKDAAGWRSVPLLASCKADVDNLGLLFSLGFGIEEHERMLSISRFVSLSRMMHRFFSAWLVQLVEREFPNIYVVFAGGDDLFVIGPWNEVIRFSVRMRQEFARFTGDNPDVTLSAGIGVVKPRLPILSIRKLSEDGLESSKNFSDENGKVKNAVTMLGVTCTWDSFITNLDIGRRLESLCIEKKVSQGFVRRLLGYARECREFRKGDIGKGLYLSHLTYDMARICEQTRLDAEETRWLYELPHKHFPDVELGVSWALYRTRQS